MGHKKLTADQLETAWNVGHGWPDETIIRGHIAALEAEIAELKDIYQHRDRMIDELFSEDAARGEKGE